MMFTCMKCPSTSGSSARWAAPTTRQNSIYTLKEHVSPRPYILPNRSRTSTQKPMDYLVARQERYNVRMPHRRPKPKLARQQKPAPAAALKINGKFEELIQRSLKVKKPANGWPKPPK